MILLFATTGKYLGFDFPLSLSLTIPPAVGYASVYESDHLASSRLDSRAPFISSLATNIVLMALTGGSLDFLFSKRPNSMVSGAHLVDPAGRVHPSRVGLRPYLQYCQRNHVRGPRIPTFQPTEIQCSLESGAIYCISVLVYVAAVSVWNPLMDQHVILVSPLSLHCKVRIVMSNTALSSEIDQRPRRCSASNNGVANTFLLYILQRLMCHRTLHQYSSSSGLVLDVALRIQIRARAGVKTFPARVRSLPGPHLIFAFPALLVPPARATFRCLN
jgi:hypothetical protein